MTITEQVPCRISILLVTYNHENYIRQALDSLFGQVIDEPIELIVVDDASSDSTVDVIKEYEAKDDRFRFKYLDNAANLGITKNYQRGFASCSSEYVAVLEGDDYWISPFKLRRQMDFLDFHWECDLCSVNYFVYDEDRSLFTPRVMIGDGHRFVGARDLIADNIVGNFSTCMYRNEALNALPARIFEVRSYDWFVNICVARQSLIGFLEEPQSVYRLHSDGVWTQESSINKLQIQLDMIPVYDEITNHVFHAEFDRLSHRLKRDIAVLHVASYRSYSIIKSIARILLHFVEYVPPVLITLMHAILPPKFKRLLIKLFHGGRSV